jgi:hypothetical protein
MDSWIHYSHSKHESFIETVSRGIMLDKRSLLFWLKTSWASGNFLRLRLEGSSNCNRTQSSIVMSQGFMTRNCDSRITTESLIFPLEKLSWHRKSDSNHKAPSINLNNIIKDFHEQLDSSLFTQNICHDPEKRLLFIVSQAFNLHVALTCRAARAREIEFFRRFPFAQRYWNHSASASASLWKCFMHFGIIGASAWPSAMNR